MPEDSAQAGKRSYVFPLALLAIVIGLGAYFILDANNSGPSLPVVKPAPDFELRDWDGLPVDSGKNKGKVVLLEFMFTSCPDICPLTTYRMAQLQETLKQRELFGTRVQFVSVTFDPERDTPEVLKAYASRMKMDTAGWDVLRGDIGQAEKIASQYDVTVQDLGEGQFVHTVTSLQLIDADQRIRKVYPMGDELNKDEVLADIESLLEEGA
ncbi:SCO family protein [Cohnella boryungensis]|uniref:SCO family protein n=1 Tax=Cohnella boryungensis TaxID=768479 RepID=A0ABV8SD64_9BACL